VIYLLGDGGHADVVEDAFGQVDARVVVSSESALGEGHLLEAVALDLDPACTTVLNVIGFLGGAASPRKLAYQRFVAKRFAFLPIVDDTAVVKRRVGLGPGAQILMGAMLNTASEVGENTIVNTGAVIEHHASVGDHSHLGPRSTVCGGSRIGNDVFVGAGAVVIQGVSVPDGSIVGAGAVVTTSFESAGVFVGCPARPIRSYS